MTEEKEMWTEKKRGEEKKIATEEGSKTGKQERRGLK